MATGNKRRKNRTPKPFSFINFRQFFVLLLHFASIHLHNQRKKNANQVTTEPKCRRKSIEMKTMNEKKDKHMKRIDGGCVDTSDLTH